MNCKDLDQSLIEGDNAAAGSCRGKRVTYRALRALPGIYAGSSPTAVPDPPSELLVQNIKERLSRV